MRVNVDMAIQRGFGVTHYRYPMIEEEPVLQIPGYTEVHITFYVPEMVNHTMLEEAMKNAFSEECRMQIDHKARERVVKTLEAPTEMDYNKFFGWD